MTPKEAYKEVHVRLLSLREEIKAGRSAAELPFIVEKFDAYDQILDKADQAYVELDVFLESNSAIEDNIVQVIKLANRIDGYISFIRDDLVDLCQQLVTNTSIEIPEDEIN